MDRLYTRALIYGAALSIFATVATAQPVESSLKALLQTELALFVLMLAASFCSGLNQIIKAQRSGADLTMADYWKHWPEFLWMLMNNTIAFAVLILTDQLNYASALGIGFVANSVADLYTKNGRSADVAARTPGNS